MQVSKKEAQSLFEAIGLKAASWENTKLEKFLNKFPTIEGHDRELEEPAVEALRERVLAACEEGVTVKLTFGRKEGESASEKPDKPKSPKKPKKPKAGKVRVEEDQTDKGDEEASANKSERSRLMGHSLTAVARWMGWDGFTRQQAAQALNELGASEAIRQITLYSCLSAGRRADEKWGKRAKLSRDQQQELRRAGGKESKARRTKSAVARNSANEEDE